jgi:NUMOD3 motif
MRKRHHGSRYCHYWTKDKIIESARRYTTKKEWDEHDHAAQAAARRLGCMAEATAHMPAVAPGRGLYSRTAAQKEAMIERLRPWQGKFRGPHTPETRAKLSQLHRGKKLSIAHRAAIGRGNLGGKRSEETKAKMSVAARKRQPISVKTISKIRTTLLGRQPPAAAAAASRARKGICHSLEHRLAMRGPRSQAHIAKLRVNIRKATTIKLERLEEQKFWQQVACAELVLAAVKGNKPKER